MVKDDLCVEALGVFLHALHQLRTLHTLIVAGPVVDVCGGGQLPALLQTGDHHRRQVGAGRIDRGGVAGGA